MDKYEAAVAQIMKLGDKEREEMISLKKKLCICGRCPTYNECAKEKTEIWYCALGKSPECIKEKNGCLVQIVRYTKIWDSRNHISVYMDNFIGYQAKHIFVITSQIDP